MDESEGEETERESEESPQESIDSIGSARTIWHDKYAKTYPELFRDDVSIYPSYTKFQVPYPVTCRQRYHEARLRYCRRFRVELLVMEMSQQRAIDGVRMRRIMSSGHWVGRRGLPDPLSLRERQHLNDLLNTRKLFED